MRALHTHVLRVHCTLCRQPLFTVRDTRFGLPPPAVVCRECTLLAFRSGAQDR